MSLKHAAKHLAAHGRGPDTELIHMTKGEINSLQTLAKANGGSLTINPHTGLAEAGFLSSILPTLAGGAAMYFSGGAINPATIGMITGGLQYARTGSLQKGIMAGMGAYGGAGMAGGLMSAGTSAAQNAAMEGAKSTAETALTDQAASSTAAELAGNQSAAESARLAAQGQTVQQAQAQAAANATNQAMATPGQTMWEGAKSLTDKAGRDAFGSYATGMGSSAGKLGLSAAAPAIGEMLKPQMNAPTAPAGDSKMPQRLQYNPGRATDAQGQTATPPPDVPEYGDLGRDFGKQQSYFPNAGYQKISDEEAKELRGYAGGGPVEAMSNANSVGQNTGYPMADISGHSYSTPFQTPVSQNVVSGAQDVAVDPYTGQEQRSMPAAQAQFAKGGLSAAASHLGDYSDGGRLLKGPGDGVSDSIPATIGNKRPARLADGEFVVPARIVSELGNGSTEAGARKLYAMLDRVQAARKKSIGKGKVAKNSRADKLLPA
jgi:hypothetical protein